MNHNTSTWLRAAARLLALTGLLLAIGGCASVKMAAPTATAGTVEKLRGANMAPASVGAFALAAGKNPEMDRTLNNGLRGSSVTPASGSFSQQLKETIATELRAAGLYDERSTTVIEGKLTDSKVDAAMGTGTGRLAAQFTVSRAGKRVFDKEIAVDAQWESSFVGAVALPAAINQYNAMYKTLAAKLFDDPEFRAAVAR
jgi:hypothetical protein